MYSEKQSLGMYSETQSTVPSCLLLNEISNSPQAHAPHSNVLFYNRPTVTEQADRGPSLQQHKLEDSIPAFMLVFTGVQSHNNKNSTAETLSFASNTYFKLFPLHPFSASQTTQQRTMLILQPPVHRQEQPCVLAVQLLSILE